MSQPKSISEYRAALRAAEAKIARLEGENAQLKERVRKLEGRLEAAQRAAKRQAGAFSLGSGSRAVGHRDDVRARSMVGTRTDRYLSEWTRSCSPTCLKPAQI